MPYKSKKQESYLRRNKPEVAKKFDKDIKKMKSFKAHMMYKGTKAVKANTNAEHLKLKKMGYGHTKPKGGKSKTDKPLYKPFVSKAKNKKYSVYVKGASGKPKLIHFGDKRYQQFKDKLGHYKRLDHGDPKRKANYYSRHGKATTKDSAKYWSHKILW